jgi:hypothetical protein
METLINKNDIQGLIVRAYPELRSANYVMIQFSDSKKTKEWLLDILPRITIAEIKPDDFALQIAFTYSGISKLIDTKKLEKPFSREFKEGMDISSRQRILGDLDANDPKNWTWGSEQNEPIDAVLMI